MNRTLRRTLPRQRHRRNNPRRTVQQRTNVARTDLLALRRTNAFQQSVRCSNALLLLLLNRIRIALRESVLLLRRLRIPLLNRSLLLLLQTGKRTVNIPSVLCLPVTGSSDAFKLSPQRRNQRPNIVLCCRLTLCVSKLTGDRSGRSVSLKWKTCHS